MSGHNEFVDLLPARNLLTFFD